LNDVRQRIARLSPAQQALLRRRLGETRAASGPEIPRRQGPGPWPLSFAQQRLWFLAQLDPRSVAYNVASGLRLRGALDARALQGGLDALVERHEVLRTTFTLVDDEPVQVIGPPRPVEIVSVDLTGGPAAERAAALERGLAEAAARPFDLEHDLMLRGFLARVAENEHVLQLALHHIACDGWSMGVLFRELAEAYTALVQQQAPAWPDLPIQYADYAVWQRQWLAGPELTRQLAYWRARLAGAPAVLELPADRSRPPVWSGRGRNHLARLPARVTSELEALSRAHGVTLFMSLLAGFATLLHRLTGRHDIVVASPMAERTPVQTEPLIGFFVNTLVLRTDLAGDPTFAELLSRVREVALGAFAHRELPFEKLVEDLRPKRNPGHSPLVQVMFALQTAQSEQPADFSGLTATRLTTETDAVKFDLSVLITPEAGELSILARYSTDLFEPATIEDLIARYRALLAGVVADPGRPLSALPLQERS
jgi:hypothetical protein